ncbi:MAG: malate dehydrogenase, partial [Gammaproteobacteria bacterium]|nr:malate dehydrogenase [Gammaproteobacteria bacterium]
ATQYPDITNVVANGAGVSDQVDQNWLVNDFIPTVQNRGTAIIRARGASSAASAASAAIDHIRDWVLGTPEGDWVSMAIPSDGSYDIQEGLMYSFPVTCSGGDYHIVQGLNISDFSRERMSETEQELKTEVEAVSHLV